MTTTVPRLQRRLRTVEWWTNPVAVVFFVFFVASVIVVSSSTVQATATATTASAHDDVDVNDNIRAVIVSSSRYWFNYRHAMNALGMYQRLKSNGVRDENIVLMIADEYAVNARNPFKNRMHATGVVRRRGSSWYSYDTELDYRGSDVTVEAFVDALLGRSTKSLRTDADSNVLIYVTGHGGDQFFKFQDEEELTAKDIANLLDRMHAEGRYKQLLFVADTCQAFTLFDKVTAPDVLALGTSLRGENAYAHHSDKDVGLAVIERWTHAFLTGYETLRRDKNVDTATTLHDLMVAPFPDDKALAAHVGVKEDTSVRKFKDVPLNEFFGTPSKAAAASDSTAATAAAKVKGAAAVTDVVPNDDEEASNSDTARILLSNLPGAKKDDDETLLDWSSLLLAQEESGGKDGGRGDHIPRTPYDDRIGGSVRVLAGFLVALVLATAAEKRLVHHRS